MDKEGHWVTINGTHVFVKDGQSPMDAFIRQKGKSVNKKFKDIDGETPEEFKQNRKEYVNNNIKFEESSKGNFHTLKAIVDNDIAGDIRYENDNGITKVIYIGVNEDYRRSGVATHLYKELQKKQPNNEIEFGEFTDEGKKLVEKIGKITRTKTKGGFTKHYGKINL